MAWSSGRDEESVHVSSVMNVLRRRWRTMAACVLVGVMLGSVAALLVPARYTAQAVVVVNPISVDPLSDSVLSPRDISTETEARVVGSSSVAERAAAVLGDETAQQSLLDGLSVSTPADSQALDISYTAATPTQAAAGANALAEAYLSYRADLASQRSQSSADDIARRVEALESQLAEVDRTLLADDSSEGVAQAESIRRDYVQEITDLRRQATGLGTTTSSPGQIVDRAVGPGSPSSAGLPIFVVGGLLLGTLVGVALALWRDGRDDRVTDAEELQDAVQAPTLAVLPAVRQKTGVARRRGPAERDGVAAEAAEGYRVLVAKLEAPAVSRGASSFLVVNVPQTGANTAAGLAIALVERGRSVVLVAPADRVGVDSQADDGPVDDDGPALSVGSVQGVPGLSVLPLSKDGGRLSPDAVRQLAQRHERVVVDATGLSESQLLTIAAGVEGAVLAATEGRSDHAQLASLAAELAQVGTPVVGTILFSPGRRRTSTTRPLPGRQPARSASTAREPANW